MQFQKQDMIGTDYTWEGNSLFTGMPTRRRFDRFDGNQVLFIINTYGSANRDFSVHHAQEIERKIREQLPMESKSEITVYNWITSEMNALHSEA